jgi:hypothetical protein
MQHQSTARWSSSRVWGVGMPGAWAVQHQSTTRYMLVQPLNITNACMHEHTNVKIVS